METPLRSLIVLSCLVSLLGACKKDKATPVNFFTYNSKTYETGIGQYISNGSTESNLVLMSKDFTAAGFSGKINAVDVLLDFTTIQEGTFTYKKDSDPTYDKTKNFYDATVAVDLTYANGAAGEGTLLEDITSGTVTITKNGTNYNIVYTMDYGGQTVTGKYTGAVPNVQD